MLCTSPIFNIQTTANAHCISQLNMYDQRFRNSLNEKFKCCISCYRTKEHKNFLQNFLNSVSINSLHALTASTYFEKGIPNLCNYKYTLSPSLAVGSSQIEVSVTISVPSSDRAFPLGGDRLSAGFAVASNGDRCLLTNGTLSQECERVLKFSTGVCASRSGEFMWYDVYWFRIGNDVVRSR